MEFQAAAIKRKNDKLSLKNIFGLDDESLIFINKMLPSYFQNLAYQARCAKKKYGWKSVSNNNGNICIKINNESPLITISTLAQLEAIPK